MRKVILTAIILIFSRTSFSAVYGIEDFISNFESSSSYKEIEGIERRKVELEEREAKYGQWKKIDVNAKLNYYNFSEIEDRKNTSFDDSYAEVDYNMFFISATSECEYDTEYENECKLDMSTLNTGIKKDVLDLFYSEQKHKKRIVQLKKKRFDTAIKSELYSKEKELIDAYKEAIDIQLDTDILNEKIRENSLLLEMIEVRAAENEAVQLEVEDKKLQVFEQKEELSKLKAERENRIKKLCLLANIEYAADIELKDFPELNLDEVNVPVFQLVILDIDKKIGKQKIKYLKRNKWGKLVSAAGYDVINEDWKFELSIQKTFFGDDTSINNKTGDIEKLGIEKGDLEESLKIEKKRLEEQFLYLRKKVDFSKERSEMQKNRYLTAKRIFDKKLLSRKEFMTIEKEFNISTLEYLKNLNSLNSFRYKMAQLEKIESGFASLP